ncbi:cell pole-organizing protein PopZ [Rhizobium petrolearium]|uniref:PopZ family protein n=1 Tax=Neorhizobium petrolearium TaxID=515361 RepID=UPI001AE31EF5|nr:DUF2497 domain-containing protein [Neorhizobium petrolearium]MBP1847988.1 cell pole-organizing protein PopZ [Neorhizobium petrolearium]
MAQPNVAREPSMEEILASIRRIIESNEPNAENVPSRPLSSAYDEEGMEDSEETGFIPDRVANDPGIPSRNEPLNSVQRPSSEPAQPERTLSLADVAARVRAASARQQEMGSVRLSTAPVAPEPVAPAPAPAYREEEEVARPRMTRMSDFREPGAAAAPAAPVSQASSVTEAPEAVHRAPSPVLETPEQSPEAEMPPRPAPQFMSEPAPESLPARIEEAANLLSAEAGAQVARSFSELAAVFNGLEHRSLEEMAQDMLRPMMQEWLDDNLPTLVERLVREEIERVARGPRR